MYVQSPQVLEELEKEFNFQTYMDSIAFINQLAEISEKNNHHPDIYIGWCSVNISIASHDLGGVTTNCVRLAVDIDSIFEK